jgi:hypothetical protein
MKKRLPVLYLLAVIAFHQNSAQSLLNRADSILAARYYRNTGIDTAYISRPATKWTLTARLNVSGATIEAKGIDNGNHFNSKMEANSKATLSLGLSYLGFSLNASLNPAKLMGKYSDYELNFNSYGRRFGFDVIYQDAKNFSGWHDHEGMGRITLPDGLLSVKTLNLNAFYVFNSRRFSYPAAFSQSFIQRRSAGSFLLAASAMGQRAALDWQQPMKLKMTNIALGAGYAFNFVPKTRRSSTQTLSSSTQTHPSPSVTSYSSSPTSFNSSTQTHPSQLPTFNGWLFHISALPTFIVYSNTSMTFGDDRIPLHYHFPEVVITGRGAVLRQWGNKFLGLSMVYNFTNIGNDESLALHNTKWRVRTFFGLRM